MSDLPEHSEVLRSTSVTGMHPGKATHTAMSTLPGSPKQCSKVSSSTSSHGDLCLCPYSCILAQYYNMGNCIFCSFWQCLVSSCFLILAFSLSTKQTQRLEETYLNSKILTEFPEGNIRLTKLKSPTYTLPSGPEAKATGAKSLLLWARPLQLVQATLRWCPLPIMVDMTGGCWEMNIFSPFPLCMIPRSKGKKKELKKLPHSILSDILISHCSEQEGALACYNRT